MSFELEKLPSGNLKLKIVQDEWEEDRDWDRLIQQSSDGGIGELLEEGGYIGNGWSQIDADQTGDMTDSPMICDDYTVEDNGDLIVYGNVWWFPNYQVEDPIKTLRDEGEVVFKLAHPAGELIPFKYTRMALAIQPHGLCEGSKFCVEHRQNKKLPSCKRGKGRRVP